jgi:hypothetical protein
MRSLVRFAAIPLLTCCALVDPSRNVTIAGDTVARAESQQLGPRPSEPLAPTPDAVPSASDAANTAEEDEISGFLPLSRGELWARWNALRGDAYELDAIERRLSEGERATCDPKAMVAYRGSRLRYYGALTVSEPFKARLERFEEVAAEVAREVYGREPSRIRHYGAYSCRPTRNRAWIVSEHALGNALDLVGFDFGAANKQQPLTEGLPASLKHSFQVRVGKHWAKTDGIPAIHARFLQLLTERLQERGDVFRCMFGPGHGGHDDHLHLDVAPYRYVDL